MRQLLYILGRSKVYENICVWKLSFTESFQLVSVENVNYVLLPPATKLRQGNVFTPVCDSVHGGVSVPAGTTDHITGGSLSRGVSVQGGVSVRDSY